MIIWIKFKFRNLDNCPLFCRQTDIFVDHRARYENWVPVRCILKVFLIDSIIRLWIYSSYMKFEFHFKFQTSSDSLSISYSYQFHDHISWLYASSYANFRLQRDNIYIDYVLRIYSWSDIKWGDTMNLKWYMPMEWKTFIIKNSL